MESFIANVEKFTYSDDKVFIGKSIPGKKLSNAILSYGFGVVGDDVLVLIDDTVFGSAKDGLIITRYAISAHESFCDSTIIKFENIKSIKTNGRNLYINENKFYSFTQASKETISKIFELLVLSIEKINNKSNLNIGIKEHGIDVSEMLSEFSKKSSYYKKSLYFYDAIQKETNRQLAKYYVNVANVHDDYFSGLSNIVNEPKEIKPFLSDEVCINILCHLREISINLLRDNLESDAVETISTIPIMPIVIIAHAATSKIRARTIAEAANRDIIMNNHDDSRCLFESIKYFSENIYRGEGARGVDYQFSDRISEVVLKYIKEGELENLFGNGDVFKRICEYSIDYSGGSRVKMEKILINLLE